MQTVLSIKDIQKLANLKKVMPDADDVLTELCGIVAERITSVMATGEIAPIDFVINWELATNKLCRDKNFSVETEAALSGRAMPVVRCIFPKDFVEEVSRLKNV